MFFMLEIKELYWALNRVTREGRGSGRAASSTDVCWKSKGLQKK